MKELKALTRQERKEISLHCEAFFLESRQTKKFKVIYTTIVKEVGIKYNKELWCVITACGKALRYGNKYSYLSLKQQDYTTANKMHKQGVSKKRMVDLIHLLETLGYIVFYKGYKNRKESYKSCFSIETPLLSLFKGLDVGVHGLDRCYKGCIELKVGDVVITSFRGYKDVVSDVDIIKFNKVLSSSNIGFDGSTLTPEYKRVFSENFDRGGRFYSRNGFQSLSKEERSTLIIDNSLCCELDYKAIHPSILYTKEGVALVDDFDPYYTHCDMPRGDVKFLFMCCLYAHSKTAATRAYINERGGKYQQVQKVIDLLMTHNKPIKHYFFKEGLWAELQNLDSTIADYIINTFTEKSIPILPWHDSFCVKEEDEYLLGQTMVSAWDHVLGDDTNCKITKEF